MIESGKISPKEMIALWDISEGSAHDVHVFRRSDQPAWSQRLPCSHGACNAGWMDGTDDLETPMGLFLMMALQSFRSREDKITALREFASVDGQGWADALLRHLGEDTGSDDP
jgi:hypothetical protein